jgi:alkylphosphonate utilization operon protein PhnA
VSTLPPCPKCNSEYTYEDGAQLICPECAHEWSASGDAETADDVKVYKDSAGTVLTDGDTITVIKDLKIKGTSLVVKSGHQGQEYPPVRRRPRYRLQDRWHWPDETQIRVRTQGLILLHAFLCPAQEGATPSPPSNIKKRQQP